MSVNDVLAFKDQLNLLLGALITYIGFYIQGRLSAKQLRNKLLLEKIERAYTLCQLVYEGHKREIENARKNFLSNRKVYISKRKHPGQEMSELKMLLRCYVPELNPFEVTLNLSHKPLKDELFKILDESTSIEKSFDSAEFDSVMIKCDDHLKHLGETTVQLKKKLAGIAGSYVG
jgi:hypothetical protein